MLPTLVGGFSRQVKSLENTLELLACGNMSVHAMSYEIFVVEKLVLKVEFFWIRKKFVLWPGTFLAEKQASAQPLCFVPEQKACAPPRNSQWFCLVPLTRFGPILRKKSSDGMYFFLVKATQKKKNSSETQITK